jgi:hypothetical protein
MLDLLQLFPNSMLVNHKKAKKKNWKERDREKKSEWKTKIIITWPTWETNWKRSYPIKLAIREGIGFPIVTAS